MAAGSKVRAGCSTSGMDFGASGINAPQNGSSPEWAMSVRSELRNNGQGPQRISSDRARQKTTQVQIEIRLRSRGSEDSLPMWKTRGIDFWIPCIAYNTLPYSSCPE